MQIIEQISEDTFIVKMDENCDLHPRKAMVIAHDYVQFNGDVGLSSDSSVFKEKGLTGKYAWCNNWIHMYGQVQIPIRLFSQLLLPKLQNHEYLQKEHLVDEQGNPKYHGSYNKYFYNGKVYLRPEMSTEFQEYTPEEYQHLVDTIKWAEDLS